MGLFGEEKVVYRPVDEFYVGPKSDHVYVRANVKGSTSSLYPFDPPLFLVSLSFFPLPLLICFRMILSINLRSMNLNKDKHILLFIQLGVTDDQSQNCSSLILYSLFYQ